MKITTIPTIGVLTFALAGCIARDDHYDHDHSIHHQSDSSADSSAAVSSSSVPEASSSSVISEASSSSTPEVSSSSESSSSSSQVVVVSSSSVAPSSSAMSSSSAPASSSSAEASSSSVPMVNIEDLTFTAELKEDQSVETDTLADLGSILIGLIDKDAFNEFYLGLVAQGLNEAAINKAVSVLGPIGSALGADFIFNASEMELLPLSETINFEPIARPLALGAFGEEYIYKLEQNLDGVDVKLDLALRFPTNVVAFRPSGNTYAVNLDSLQVVVNEFSLTTSEVEISLDTTDPVIFSAQILRPIIALTEDGANIVSVQVGGQNITLNLKGAAVNGIIGVAAEGSGTMTGLNANIDMQSGNSTIDLQSPDITVQMQGVDTSN